MLAAEEALHTVLELAALVALAAVVLVALAQALLRTTERQEP
jgi:hypothetical protein